MRLCECEFCSSREGCGCNALTGSGEEKAQMDISSERMETVGSTTSSVCTGYSLRSLHQMPFLLLESVLSWAYTSVQLYPNSIIKRRNSKTFSLVFTCTDSCQSEIMQSDSSFWKIGLCTLNVAIWFTNSCSFTYIYSEQNFLLIGLFKIS